MFQRPVHVGSLLQLDSCVLYTSWVGEQPHMHVEVVATVTVPEQRDSQVSNTFNFTFALNDGAPAARVLPGTEEEAKRIVARMQADAVQHHAGVGHYGPDNTARYVW